MTTCANAADGVGPLGWLVGYLDKVDISGCRAPLEVFNVTTGGGKPAKVPCLVNGWL